MATPAIGQSQLNPLFSIDPIQKISFHQKEAKYFLYVSRIALTSFSILAMGCIATSAILLPSYVLIISGLMLPAAQKFFNDYYNPLSEKHSLHTNKVILYQRISQKLPSSGSFLRANYSILQEDSNKALVRLEETLPRYRAAKAEAKEDATKIPLLRDLQKEKLNLQFAYFKLRMEEIFLAYILSNPTSLANYNLSIEPLGKTVMFTVLPDITTSISMSHLIKAHKIEAQTLTGQKRNYTNPEFIQTIESNANNLFIQKFKQHDISVAHDPV
jgi:hypothetical protein